MIEVICDTNFLIHLANRRIKNLDRIPMEIGSITFVVPDVVYSELKNLKNIPNKKDEIENTLLFIKKFNKIPICGTFADKEILEYIKNKRCFIGTMDRKLKKSIKNLGSNIISFQNNKMILES